MELHIAECAILCIICEDYDKSMFSAFFERHVYTSAWQSERDWLSGEPSRFSSPLPLLLSLSLLLLLFISFCFIFTQCCSFICHISYECFMRKWDGETLKDSKQQVVDNVREDETILHFQKSVQIPLFNFPQKLGTIFSHRTQILSAKTWKIWNSIWNKTFFSFLWILLSAIFV